jgi:hypothetical protein
MAATVSRFTHDEATAAGESNLVVACYTCNADKGVRTDVEFANRPNDPISKLVLSPSITIEAMECERQGYTGFNEPWPF